MASVVSQRTERGLLLNSETDAVSAGAIFPLNTKWPEKVSQLLLEQADIVQAIDDLLELIIGVLINSLC